MKTPLIFPHLPDLFGKPERFDSDAQAIPHDGVKS